MSSNGVRVRVAVCLRDGDRILLAEHVKHGRRHWLLPGGGVEAGETMVGAAAREMLITAAAARWKKVERAAE